MSRNRLAAILCAFVVLGSVGCASRPTMEELEKEAAATGDWTEVEKREEMDRRMGRYNPNFDCPSGEALYCATKGEREECSCVASNELRRQP